MLRLETEIPAAAETPISLEAIPLTSLGGEQLSLGDWQQPVLVVNFWAPWCVPCRREIPTLVSLQEEYNTQIQVLGLAIDGIDNIREFAKETPMNYPSFLAIDKIPLYNAAFNNRSGSLPFTAIIDRERKIIYTHSGEISLDELRQNINPLL